MFSKRIFPREFRRLFQSSIFIGVVMALAITPPVVVDIFAAETKAECEKM